MRESTRAILVIVAFVAALLAGYELFLKPYIGEETKVHGVLTEYSTWTVTMQEYLMTGPLAAETFRLHNDNGKTTMYYAATDRGGTTKFFNVPLQGPAGTFLFQELEGDGIWELDDKAVRPHPRDEYVVVVAQTLGSQGGTRAFGFSDPPYWATTNAREFLLSLPKRGPIQGPGSKVVTAYGGRPLRDDRYLKIVEAIKRFGPPSVQQAENKIRYELLSRAVKERPSALQ